MESISEVIIISNAVGKENCGMYDLFNGTLLENYKDGCTVRNGLDFIGNEYLISALNDKQRIKIWQFGQSNEEFHKITSPGFVTALAVSKCGRYCVAGVGNKTCVWDVATGSLDFCMEYHSQDITCIRFSSDSSHFITGGKDGIVFVFMLSEAISARSFGLGNVKPRFVWSHHSCDITDMHVGCMGPYSRIATASRDMTCNIYELDTGLHLCTIHMESEVTAVTMDMCEYFMYLGVNDGNIYRINLFDMTEAEMHFDEDQQKNAFVGHKDEITSLCINFSGQFLISGSADKEVKVWVITNFLCFRTIPFPGPITNVITSLLPPGIKNRKYVPRLLTNTFQKTFDSEEESLTSTNLRDQKLSLFHAGAPDDFCNSKAINCSSQTLEEVMKRGSLTIEAMSQINNRMYAVALNSVIQTVSSTCSGEKVNDEKVDDKKGDDKKEDALQTNEKK